MRGSVIKLSSPATREFWEIPVLFEDEHLLALDKPPRLLTSPDRSDPERPNLIRLLHAGIAAQKPWARERGLGYVMNAHRLDFEISGVLLFAKSKPVLLKLVALFVSQPPLKTCIALVHGQPAAATWDVDAPLARHPARPGVMRVDRKSGQRSRTHFELVESFDGYSLVHCQPFTARPDPIRVHLRHSELPIVGDALYGGNPLLLSSLKSGYRLKAGKRERPLLDSTALHVERLQFAHPETGFPVMITAPWPKGLAVAVKYLRRYAAAGPPSKEAASS